MKPMLRRRMRKRVRRFTPMGHDGRAPWRRRFAFLFALTMLVAAPIVARSQGADSVALVWTAPGDDGTLGAASLFDLRMSASPITLSNWDAATPVAGVPAPLLSGTPQQVTVYGLTQGTTYYFAIRSQDDAGNWSAVSNVLRWDWIIDSAPPGAPTGLQASATGGSVALQWSAGPEPDLVGYSVYRSDTPNGVYTLITGSLLTSPQYTDDLVPAGWGTAAYKVTATDGSGNESARSAAASVSFAGETPVALTLQPAFPNPSRGSDPAYLPVVVPPTGASGVLIDLLDAGGHRVRRLDLSALAPGTQNVAWDGRNDAGRTVAPGVYTAVLISGRDRQRVRLVRTP